MAHPIFHLELTCRTCGLEVRLNDFPVAELTSSDQPSWFAPPVNPWLVGELNILDVTIHSAGGSAFDDAAVEGHVRRFEKGDIVAPGEGPEIFAFTIPDELRERVREEELELPQSFSVVFANDEIDFSDELSTPPPFDDREALLDYAIHLRDLLRAQDVDGLVAEFAPKANTWARAFDEPEPGFVDSLREELREFFAEGVETDFERSDLALAPACGGRIWELMRSGDLPLMRSVELEEEGRSFWRVFAGERDGGLKVVR